MADDTGFPIWFAINGCRVPARGRRAMKALLPLFALAALAGGCSKPAADLQCPLPESGSAADSLRETPQQIDAAAADLGAGTANEIEAVVSTLRNRHPDTSKAAIVNYIVTAYCPKIKANPALDRAQKQDAMLTFSGRVEQIANAR
ncbi:MAG: hypothetical protein B7Y45_01690 [Sphingomonas sp. 28-66-16]|nr:MAG: hypothetical protein B7Y45_01690 [Sphingomonas sp. 28-66-16]